MSSDNRMSELQNEARIKSFEAERTHMVYEETVRNLKDTQLEAEKTQKKLEVCDCDCPNRTLCHIFDTYEPEPGFGWCMRPVVVVSICSC